MALDGEHHSFNEALPSCRARRTQYLHNYFRYPWEPRRMNSLPLCTSSASFWAVFARQLFESDNPHNYDQSTTNLIWWQYRVGLSATGSYLNQSKLIPTYIQWFERRWMAQHHPSEPCYIIPPIDFTPCVVSRSQSLIPLHLTHQLRKNPQVHKDTVREGERSLP